MVARFVRRADTDSLRVIRARDRTDVSAFRCDTDTAPHEQVPHARADAAVVKRCLKKLGTRRAGRILYGVVLYLCFA